MKQIIERRPAPQKRLFSLDFWVRIGGMLVLAYLGWSFGNRLSVESGITDDEWRATQLLALSGAGLGLLISHRVLLDPIRDLNRRLRGMAGSDLIAIVIGGFLGATFGALLTTPSARLPGGRTMRPTAPCEDAGFSASPGPGSVATRATFSPERFAIVCSSAS